MSASPSSSRTRSTRLQDRYELLDELPHVTGGRLFRARDLAFGETVGIKQLGAGCGLPPAERRQVEDMVRHLQCLPHPHLVRLYTFDADAGLLIQEWVNGISLLDLLRRRREFRGIEAMMLLSALPATLDFLAREAVPAPRPLLGKIFIQFEGDVADSIYSTPLDQWPAFTLKLNAFSLRGIITLPANDDTTTHTVIADPRQPTDISESYGPREFARLLYELLGGRIRELDARRYSPLPALQESGNAVLRRTLLAMPHTDCQSLWNDLVAAQPELNRPAPAPLASSIPGSPPLRIPEPLVTKPHPATLLQLEPTDAHTTSIRLVARPRFNIGRSTQHADFVARLLPENDTNNALTNRLSRIHSFLEATPDGLQVRDGNGNGPSLNGSSLDGEPLMPNPATPLPHRSFLQLGDEYSLELVPVCHLVRRSLSITNLEAWRGPGEKPAGKLTGGIVCLPSGGQPATREAAWIFTEVGFGLSATERLVWDTRGRSESPAAFHYFRGCFWIRNRSLPESAIVCNGTPLHRNEILPLCPGQTLDLGSHTFTIRLE